MTRAKDATQSERDQLPSSLLQLYRLMRNPLGVKPRKLMDPQAPPGSEDAQGERNGKKKQKKGKKKKQKQKRQGDNARLSQTQSPAVRRRAPTTHTPQRPATAGATSAEQSAELEASLSVLRGHSRDGARTARSGMEATSRSGTRKPGKPAKRGLVLPGPVDKYGGTRFRDRTAK